MYLFSVSKNGVSAKEIERQLGVKYKTPWRMANKVRELMEEDVQVVSGIVEIGNIRIIPRGDDLPNHYIKKDSLPGTMDHSRMNIILNAENIFSHKHENCGNHKITVSIKKYKKGHRLIFKFSCKKSRFVIEKNNLGYILVTAYEMKGNDIIKNNRERVMKKEILETNSIEEILQKI